MNCDTHEAGACYDGCPDAYDDDDGRKVIREVPVAAHPGWVIREYRDGTFDATHDLGISPDFASFAEALAHIREESSHGADADDLIPPTVERGRLATIDLEAARDILNAAIGNCERDDTLGYSQVLDQLAAAADLIDDAYRMIERGAQS